MYEWNPMIEMGMNEFNRKKGRRQKLKQSRIRPETNIKTSSGKSLGKRASIELQKKSREKGVVRECPNFPKLLRASVYNDCKHRQSVS